jgi:Tfp pilus assembly protein PilF
MTQAIFLSYASQDADTARRICEALRAAGLEVWFDQNELRGGDAWDASIRKQIKECALFVPIISDNTQEREEGYFRLEWKLAVDRSHLMADNKAFFFPVILGDVPEAKALVPDKFRERQWTRITDEPSIAKFAERIKQIIMGAEAPASATAAASSAPVQTTAQRPAAPAIPSRRRTIATLATLGALGAAGGGIAIWRPWQQRGSGPSGVPRDPQLERARELLESIGTVASDTTLAEELVKGVLTTRPTDPEAVIMMCRVHVYILQRGFDRREARFASAKEFAEKALALAPENPVAKVCMADYLLRRNIDSERALKLIEEAISTQPGVPRFHRLRNAIRNSLSRFPPSERSQFYLTTAEQFPQDTLAQHDAALSCLSREQFAEAKTYLRRAIALGPQASAGPTLASIEMWADGDLVSAKATLDQVSAKQRTAARAIIVQFWYAMLSGDTSFGQTALRAHPEPWINDFFFTGPTALLYGELLLLEGKAVLATPYFEQGYAEWAKHKQELVNQGRHAWIEPYLLFRLGKIADARSRYAIALTTIPRPLQLTVNNDWWMFRPISVSLLLGERDMALTLMREAASSPAGRQVMRNAFKLDPRMAPFRNDAAIAKILAG